MKRREFITLLGGAVAWPLGARAQQQATSVRRVGVLMSIGSDDPEAQPRVAAFEAGLRDLGWVQGRNLHIEYRWAAGQTDVLRPQAAELVASVPDLILATSTPATIALREQTRTLPIVFVFVNDPVGQGFASSFSHPGGNLTGFAAFEFAIGTLAATLPAFITAPTASAAFSSASNRRSGCCGTIAAPITSVLTASS
jgi:putative ABC transport system substrate-binding protein